MGRPRTNKQYELVDVDGAGMAFYFTVQQAIEAASDYWGLRLGWSIWKVAQDGKRTLWVQSYEDDFSWPYIQPILDAVYAKVKKVKENA